MARRKNVNDDSAIAIPENAAPSAILDAKEEQIQYYNRWEAQEAMRIVATFISRNPRVKIHYHKEKEKGVYANLRTGGLHIPTAGYGSGLSKSALWLLRGHVMHEGGHIIKTLFEIYHSWYKEDYKAKNLDAMEAFFLECKLDPLLHLIWNAIEDFRMESEISKENIGVHKTLEWSKDYYNRKIALDFEKDTLEASIDGKPVTDRKNKALWEASCAMNFRLAGRHPAWVLSPEAQSIEDCVWELYTKTANLKSNDESVNLAYEILQKLRSEMAEAMKQQEGTEQDDNGEDQPDTLVKMPGKRPKGMKNSGKPNPNGGNTYVQYEEDDEEDEGGDSADDPGDAPSIPGGPGGTEKDGGDQPGGKKKRKLIVVDLTKQTDGLSRDAAINKAIQDEIKRVPPKDCNYTAMKDSDVHEFPDVANADSGRSAISELRKDLGAATVNLTHGLEQALRAITRCRQDRFLRSGKLDNGRLVQIGKGLSREVFYQTKQGFRMDTCVYLVVDESGSMCGRIEEARKTCIALGDAMHRMNIPFEILGTTTTGSYGEGKTAGFTRYNPIRYMHYKLFSEDWNSVSWRLASMQGNANNVDGEALEYAALRMRDRKEQRKIVISICDGEPCAGQGNDSEMAGNLIRVADRLRRTGTEVYGFGVQTDGPKQYYGSKFFFELEGSDQMSSGFIRTMAGILIQGQLAIQSKQ